MKEIDILKKRNKEKTLNVVMIAMFKNIYK